MHVDHDPAKGNLLAAVSEAGFLIGVEKNRYLSFWELNTSTYYFQGLQWDFQALSTLYVGFHYRGLW